MYSVLSSASTDELDARLEAAKLEGITLSDSTQSILKMSKYLPQVRAISELQGEWTAAVITARSRRIAELVWDRVAPWLDIT